MKIAVVVRQVPDLIEPLEIAPSGMELDLGAASFILNESDDHALEQSLLLKEAHGGDTSAVALFQQQRLLQGMIVGLVENERCGAQIKLHAGGGDLQWFDQVGNLADHDSNLHTALLSS